MLETRLLALAWYGTPVHPHWTPGPWGRLRVGLGTKRTEEGKPKVKDFCASFKVVKQSKQRQPRPTLLDPEGGQAPGPSMDFIARGLLTHSKVPFTFPEPHMADLPSGHPGWSSWA